MPLLEESLGGDLRTHLEQWQLVRDNEMHCSASVAILITVEDGAMYRAMLAARTTITDLVGLDTCNSNL